MIHAHMVFSIFGCYFTYLLPYCLLAAVWLHEVLNYLVYQLRVLKAAPLGQIPC